MILRPRDGALIAFTPLPQCIYLLLRVHFGFLLYCPVPCRVVPYRIVLSVLYRIVLFCFTVPRSTMLRCTVLPRPQEVYVTPSRLHVAMDLIEGGNLAVRYRPKGEEGVDVIVRQIVRALRYLHDRHIAVSGGSGGGGDCGGCAGVYGSGGLNFRVSVRGLDVGCEGNVAIVSAGVSGWWY